MAVKKHDIKCMKTIQANLKKSCEEFNKNEFKTDFSKKIHKGKYLYHTTLSFRIIEILYAIYINFLKNYLYHKFANKKSFCIFFYESTLVIKFDYCLLFYSACAKR